MVLARALAGINAGFYIDVGAWHPETDSVTRWFYDRGWSGISIEPQAEYVALLNQSRSRDINLQLIISEQPGRQALWVPRHSPLASCCPEMIRDDIPDYTDAVRSEIAAERLDAVISRYAPGRDIHFLKIDVEGSECSVLRSMDLQIHRPWILVVEAISPHDGTPTWNRWEPWLLDNQYHFALFDGLNRLYVRQESLDLLPALSIPANCLDNYIPARHLSDCSSRLCEQSTEATIAVAP